MMSTEIGSDGHNDLLREFLGFDDDLILPDKPFEGKKEAVDFDQHFDDDFFVGGATPSPSSSSCTSSSNAGTISNAASTTGQNSIEFAMSIANDLMNIDFESAAEVDIDNIDDNLDFMSGYTNESLTNKKIIKEETTQAKSGHVKRQENVMIHIALTDPLKNIRAKLEKKFNVNLTSYTIWLQDTTQLNDASTLSEQCIEGSGLVKVQLNIQPFNDDGHKKINIIDVLKLDQIESDENESIDDEDDAFYDEDDDDEVIDPVHDSNDTQTITNFVESDEFCQIRKRFNFPNSLMLWTRLHTFHWTKWVNNTFPGVKLNEAKWNFDGKRLSSLTEAEFSLLAGSDPGNLLWSHFTLLRQTGMGTVPSTFTSKPSTPIPNFQVGEKRPLDMSAAARIAASVVAPPKKQRVILGKYEEAKVFINSDESHRTGNNGGNIQLWKFLLDTLTDYKHRKIIRWSLGEGCQEGEFVMSEPEGVARLWGQQKGKVTMNYEKLSRALRYYKGGNILDKVHNKKFTYRFVCDLRDIVGFTASELDQRVQEQEVKQHFL